MFPAVSIMISFSDFWGLAEFFKGEDVAVGIVKTAPVIAQDITLFGEASPFFVAAMLTILAPQKHQRRFIMVAITLCIVGWLIYLGFTVFLQEDGKYYSAVLNVITGSGESHASSSNLSVLTSFATGSRIVFIVVGAALLGFSVRREDRQ